VVCATSTLPVVNAMFILPLTYLNALNCELPVG